MGKALRPEQLQFFLSRMQEHDIVTSSVVIPDENNYVYKLERRGKPALVVVLTDAYAFGEVDASLLPKGTDYVVLGMPHANFDHEIRRRLRRSQVGIGHIGKFMAALNLDEPWQLRLKDEKAADEEEGTAGQM